MNVYDFDGTIYDGDSSVDFYLFAVSKKPLLLLLLPYQLLVLLAGMVHIASKETTKTAFFVFLRLIPAAKFVTVFWEQNNAKMRPWYLRQRQNSDVIISASPEFLLAPFVREKLQAGIIASIIDPRTGAFTGKNCYGEEKVRRFREIYGNKNIDDFYTDSLSDAPLAQIAKRAFLVKGGTVKEWRVR